jgi:nucleoside-diphosphate-sugar epimerase
MEDMVGVYVHFIEKGQDIASGNYNAGFENISIMKIADMVANKVNASIEVTPSNDPRSYRQNSDKLLSTGFLPKKSVSDAIDDVIRAYVAEDFKEEDRFYTVKWMQQLASLNNDSPSHNS